LSVCSASGSLDCRVGLRPPRNDASGVCRQPVGRRHATSSTARVAPCGRRLGRLALRRHPHWLADEVPARPPSSTRASPRHGRWAQRQCQTRYQLGPRPRCASRRGGSPPVAVPRASIAEPCLLVAGQASDNQNAVLQGRHGLAHLELQVTEAFGPKKVAAVVAALNQGRDAGKSGQGDHAVGSYRSRPAGAIGSYTD
jgi:hypothetical protein